MSGNMTQFPTTFISYPTNRLTGHFDTQQDVRELLDEVAALGVDIGSVYVLDGQEGLSVLDPTGETHGTLATLRRILRQGGSVRERDKFQGLIDHLTRGGISVAVYASDVTLRASLIELYKRHGGMDITYAARFYIENHQ